MLRQNVDGKLTAICDSCGTDINIGSRANLNWRYDKNGNHKLYCDKCRHKPREIDFKKRYRSINVKNWVWLPHPVTEYHGNHKYQFFLSTWIGNVVISTIGESDEGVEPGYKTSVFTASPCTSNCCPCVITDLSPIDSQSYGNATAARLGHSVLCSRWAEREVRETKEGIGAVNC